MALNPWLVTGFVDGEGCFSLFVRKDMQRRVNSVATYYRWQVVFAIGLRGDDKRILDQIKDFFDCGSCSLTYKTTRGVHNFGQCHYLVASPSELLHKVVPHFEKFPLQTKKGIDFELWKEAVGIIYRARNKNKSLFKKVVYTSAENKRLIKILQLLSRRVTGGHKTQRKVSYLLQGTKHVTDFGAL